MPKEINNIFAALAATAICLTTIGFLLNEAPAEPDQRKPVKLTADSWCPYNCGPEDPHALEINIEKLLAGRIQALVEDRNVMNHTLAKLGKSNEIIPAGALEAEDLFIAFSPHSPSSKEYAEILTSGLQTMRQSGALENILARYGVSARPPP